MKHAATALFWGRMSLRARVAVLVTGVSVGLVFALICVQDIETRKRERANILGRAKLVVRSADALRERIELQWESGVYSPGILKDLYERGGKQLAARAVPMVAAWDVARAHADSLGYEFRTPRFHPRNRENAPDSIEAVALRAMNGQNLEEYVVVDRKGGTLHYFRALRMTRTCLYCHGDPARSAEYWGNTDGIDQVSSAMAMIDVLSRRGAQTGDEAAAMATELVVGAADLESAMGALETVLEGDSERERITS